MLHYIIQIVQGRGDDHLHQFHIHGKDYGIYCEGDIGFPYNPFQVVIDDFAFDVGDRLTYEYGDRDAGRQWKLVCIQSAWSVF